jgi:hypothetical protein
MVMFTLNPLSAWIASYHVDWPIMSDRGGDMRAHRSSDANTRAAAWAAELTLTTVKLGFGEDVGGALGEGEAVGTDGVGAAV